MATILSTIITNSRTTLNEPVAAFWTDAELLVYAIDGCKDLWRAILDLNQGHFQTIDDTNVSLAASATTLTGVPADVFRVELIEPRDVTTANTTARELIFTPKKTNHADWSGARSLGTVDPTYTEVYYSIRNAGSPIAAPAIDVVPKLSAAVNLRLIYTPTLAAMTAASTNPIPGESDHALYAWIVAHARAREREDRKPDPEWVKVYATDKAHLLTALTPRQIQEPEVAEAFFEAYG